MELPRLPARRRGCATRWPPSGHLRFTLLDCPPSLGPLTVNALVAADRVIVPVQTEYFALEGLAGLLDTLELIQRELNPRLTVAGMLLTMHDARTKLAQDVEREVRRHFPKLVFDTVIPRNVRLGEAPSYGVPVIHHDPHCAGSDAYFELAKEVAHVAEPSRGMGRGLAALLTPADGGGARRDCASCRSSSSRPTRASRGRSSTRRPARARRLARRARHAPAGARAARRPAAPTS